jgi:hypothetical protein
VAHLKDPLNAPLRPKKILKFASILRTYIILWMFHLKDGFFAPQKIQRMSLI